MQEYFSFAVFLAHQCTAAAEHPIVKFLVEHAYNIILLYYGRRYWKKFSAMCDRKANHIYCTRALQSAKLLIRDWFN